MLFSFSYMSKLQGRPMKILRGWGRGQNQLFKGIMKLNWNFLRGGVRMPPDKQLKAFMQNGFMSLFGSVSIFCRIEVIFGKRNCFNMKIIVL